MPISPYANIPTYDWLNITHQLLARYPLSQADILDIAMLSWDRLWTSQIGGQINISDVELPATVVGYFFQKLFAHELKLRYPNIWRGEQLKNDKDLVCINAPCFSTEMKSSGQLGYLVFGNRSYNQSSASSGLSGKNKSGFYITMNFYRQTMTLLRIGWIDQDDWIPQGSATGQTAILKPEVYQYKLVDINGPYRNKSPVELLRGIGGGALPDFHAEGVYTFGDLKAYSGSNPRVLKTRSDNLTLLNSF